MKKLFLLTGIFALMSVTALNAQILKGDSIFNGIKLYHIQQKRDR